MVRMIVVLQLLLFCGIFLGAVISKDSKEVWGYVKVRKDAYMFWWLYYANSPGKNFTNLPLVMWLQGGPGGSGTGFGNFEEIGPLDKDLKQRNTTWVQVSSVLFVDNPVGTGYSYTTDDDAFAKDVSTVASDMMVLLKEFFESKKEFQHVPFYIFSESYGGKMASAISMQLYKAIQEKKIQCNFAGVALGDSWISPLDSVLSWGPYLYGISLLDDSGLGDVTAAAKRVQDAVLKGDYAEATEEWSNTENVIELNTNGVNFYNILTHASDEKLLATENSFLANLYSRHLKPLHKMPLSELMNGPIRKKLKIIPDFVTWGGQSQDVFSSMVEDFMKPVIDTVDELLTAKVNVTVYNGQLDLIVDTIGQEAWVKKLKWPGLTQFNKLKWKPLSVSPSTDTAAFYKCYQNFAFYWILKAGHMVPSDQGDMALKLLRMVTNQE
ncbi:retinoid-inducible serine carboxypeptidase [Latimeria chalumnae]|uniref:Carboxypeptidase n=1 Tax=Latimeria chalumnae TaxID=7897 RepID=H3A6Z0_LATCH|nr:PREDICTED: retinoid-inducible serine carboxypeptidase [Latimeria chalumnae]|eukprot:XP_005999984.1 PREDICTED: retinoid-inducible serine carboxypeptidase [Latimeria chalumnae]